MSDLSIFPPDFLDFFVGVALAGFSSLTLAVKSA